jgi:hypothetical protein
MPLDPDENPRGFLTVIIAAGLLIFRQNVNGTEQAFKVADQFVAETERRFGSLNK